MLHRNPKKTPHDGGIAPKKDPEKREGTNERMNCGLTIVLGESVRKRDISDEKRDQTKTKPNK